MHFTDRLDAGRKLAERLRRFRNPSTIVLALSQSAVVIGAEIAKVLDAPLGIVLVRKIPHPLEPEYAIGAMAEGGEIIYNSPEIARFSDAWRKQAEASARALINYRLTAYCNRGYTPLAIKDKTVIIVADGIAAGLAMEVAAYSIRNRQPDQIIAAAPVASQEGIDTLQEITNEVVVVDNPKNFMGAVGAHYQSFPPIRDAEVMRLLQMSRGAIGRQYT